MALPSDDGIVKALAILNIVWLAIAAGISVSMSVFMIPMIRDHDATSYLMARQFHDMTAKGAKYLQSTSRLQGILLATLAYLFYRHPNRNISYRWKYFAAAMAILVNVAWYEIVAVFPTNYRMLEIENELASSMDFALDHGYPVEVTELLTKWQWRHVGRMALPLVSIVIELVGILW